MADTKAKPGGPPSKQDSLDRMQSADKAFSTGSSHRSESQDFVPDTKTRMQGMHKKLKRMQSLPSFALRTAGKQAARP